MNRFALVKPPEKLDPICGDLMTMAERELAAFFGAVTELFGSEQAHVSAEAWLRELMERSVLPASTRQWRQFSVRVMARLASRANVSFEGLAAR